MRNKSLIIIVLSLFFIASIYGADKSYAGGKSQISHNNNILSASLTPYKKLGMRIERTEFYRPLYIIVSDRQKSEEKSLTKPLR